MRKVDWIIHYVSNHTACQECGKIEKSFPEGICDAHTHGMFRYNHPEFQVVVDYGPKEVARLLNEMGLRVQAGQQFADGDVIEGLYLDCSVQIRKVSDSEEMPILRLVIPDKQNRFPEEADKPYCSQIFSTNILYAFGKKKTE